jgi:hypothetical protein
VIEPMGFRGLGIANLTSLGDNPQPNLTLPFGDAPDGLFITQPCTKVRAASVLGGTFGSHPSGHEPCLSQERSSDS